MDLEQTVKDLQTQHAQFQETLLSLAKGKQDMMTLPTMKKKTKKWVVILNIGRRFKGPSQPVQVDDISSEEDDNQDGYGRRINNEGRKNQGYENAPVDEDFSDE